MEHRDHPNLSERVYVRLLRLYPAPFRARYEREMVQLFADQLRDARGAGSVAATWFRAFIDLASTAIGERLRRGRPLARSIATFGPTPPIRLLGLIGMSGALMLLAPFLTAEPFEDFRTNLVRLAWFASTGAAISLGYYSRLAIARPRLAFVVTAALGSIGALYAGSALGSLSASGGFDLIGVHMVGAQVPLWMSGAVFGAIVLGVGTPGRGMARWAGLATRAGAISLIASAMAVLGDDRFYLNEPDALGPWVVSIALAGVFLHGIGWLLLGLVLFAGDLGRERPEVRVPAETT